MKNKMNKKGIFGITALTPLIFFTIIAVIIFLMFISGGGIMSSITAIPMWVWLLFGIILFFKLIGGKK